MLLQPFQIQELLQIVDNFHVLFVAQQVGVDILTPDDILTLKNAGIDVEKWRGKDGKIAHAFKFGLLAEAIGNKQSKKMNYDQFKKFISSGRFLPLTQSEEAALNNLKHQAYNDIKGLGNKINHDFTQILIEVDQKKRKEYEKTVLTEAQQVILNRETVAELASRIGHKTGDWSRDLGRVADFVMHLAYDQGKAAQILKTYGEEAEVYKSVYKGACKHCIEAYLTNGLGSEPRVFKLKELIENGTNIGRKTADLKPIIGPHHPHCRCELYYKEPNNSWNQETQDFTDVKRNNYGVKRKSKVKFTITKE